LRQAADDQHDAGRAQRHGFIDAALIVVALGLPMRGIGHEHTAAAITGQFEIVVLDGFHGAVEADMGDLIAPRRDAADLLAGTGFGDGDEIALLADRRCIQRQPA